MIKIKRNNRSYNFKPVVQIDNCEIFGDFWDKKYVGGDVLVIAAKRVDEFVDMVEDTREAGYTDYETGDLELFFFDGWFVGIYNHTEHGKSICSEAK